MTYSPLIQSQYRLSANMCSSAEDGVVLIVKFWRNAMYACAVVGLGTHLGQMKDC